MSLSLLSFQNNTIIVNQVQSAELAFFNRPIANSDPKVLLFASANATKQDSAWFNKIWPFSLFLCLIHGIHTFFMIFRNSFLSVAKLKLVWINQPWNLIEKTNKKKHILLRIWNFLINIYSYKLNYTDKYCNICLQSIQLRVSRSS